MKLTNPNYCATVIKIEKIVELENCDNVYAAIIMGNQVIISKNIKVGDIGLFFPVETKLSKDYLSANNLYRKKELNSDPEGKPGYFEENGRIRCVKFRGNKSEGLFMPIDSLSFLSNDIKFKVGDEFNQIKGIKIADKYVTKVRKQQESGSPYKKKLKRPESKIIDGQFQFHHNTGQLYKNLHNLNPEDLIQLTYKLHGTSGISSYILCKKKLNWREKLLKKLGVNIVDKEYDYVYSSRRVIKNPELNPNAQHYYDADIWGLAHAELVQFLQKGLTFYYEIVGFLPNGLYIQDQYDYGCEPGTFKTFIYRITQTNEDGKVYEFSPRQVQDFCKKLGLDVVPELYYGQIDKLYNIEREDWTEGFLEYLKKHYNNYNCIMCNNKVPMEGIILRKDSSEWEVYKLKSSDFYEYETRSLDSGKIDIEEEN